MAEQNSITTPKENVPQAPLPPLPKGNKVLCEVCGEMEELRAGKKICWPCERMQMQKEKQEAARQELIKKNTEPDCLDAMFSRAVASFKSLCVILDDAEYEIVLDVLKPLLEHLEANLTKIEAIMGSTLGHVKILVCTDFMKVDGKEYCEGDFYKAILEPKEADTSVQ